MSYAVVHMQKFKTSGVKGIQFHNQRERESKTNPDIDRSQSHLNYDLHNDRPIDYNKQVKEIIENNVVTNRAIRKDAVVMCNFIVTSDKGFFDELTDQEQKKFFKESYEFFKERYGEKNIIAANVHLDEKTPHMHLSLVPTKDNKLSAKMLFNRKELKSLQDDFPKHIQKQGFNLERGVDAEGKNKHIETQKLKAMEVEAKIKALEEKLNNVQSVEVRFNDVQHVQRKKSLLGGKITLKKHDFEKIQNAALNHISDSSKINNLERQLDNYKTANLELRQENKQLRELNWNQTNENLELKKSLSEHKNFTKAIDKTLTTMFDQKVLTQIKHGIDLILREDKNRKNQLAYERSQREEMDMER